MQKLIRSRYLFVDTDKSMFQIMKRTTGQCISSHQDLIDLINRFNKPVCPLKIQPDYDQDDFLSVIQRLKELGILVSEDTAEEEDIIREWDEKIKNFSLLKNYDNNISFIFFGNDRGLARAARFTELAAPIKKELDSQIFPFKRKIYTILLSNDDYLDIAAEYKLPARTMAFVDTKSVLVINSQILSEQMPKAKTFYHSIKHELIHILLGQRHFYIPPWIEEGICELYSGQENFRLIQFILKKRKKTYKFTEAEPLITGSIMDINDSPANRNTAYAQAFSFVKYIIDTIGEKTFWSVIENTGINVNFKQVFSRITKRNIIDMENEWEVLINQESEQKNFNETRV